MTRSSSMAAALALACTSGCYHFRFEQRADPPAGKRLVTHEARVPTYLNGFLGRGTVDTTRFCAQPVRTELHVSAIDVLLSVATLLIYTPHTLSVTCEVP